MIEQPEGIVITISAGMLKEKGYKNWLTNFLLAMDQHEAEWTYWMRLGSQPKRDINYIYLCIGGKVRFRTVMFSKKTWMEERAAGGRPISSMMVVRLFGLDFRIQAGRMQIL